MDNKFETEVLTRLAVIESKIDDYKQTDRVANDAYQKASINEKDIIEIKENNKWLKRTLIGAILSNIFTIITAIILIIIERGAGLN